MSRGEYSRDRFRRRLAREMSARGKVAVLFGGRSGEHDVSLRSAESVAAGLAERHDVVCVLIDRSGRWLLQDGPTPRGEGGERVFLAADARRRGVDCGVSSTPARSSARTSTSRCSTAPTGRTARCRGSSSSRGSPTSAPGWRPPRARWTRSMMKALFAEAGLPQVGLPRAPPPRRRAGRSRFSIGSGLPVFVKPANLGSSVGGEQGQGPGRARRRRSTWPSPTTARSWSKEASTPAKWRWRSSATTSPRSRCRERSCPTASSTTTTRSTRGDSRTELLIPAPLDEEATTERSERLGVAAFRAVDACGLARVDVFVERAGGRVLLNEINTMPGFTSISMYPRLWEASGPPTTRSCSRASSSWRSSVESRRARLRTDYRP